MTNNNLLYDKSELESNLSEEDKEKKAKDEKRKQKLVNFLVTLQVFGLVIAVSGGTYYLRESNKIQNEFSRREQQILQIPGLSMAEKKVKVLNDLSDHNITPYYKKRIIQEVLDLGYDVIEKHTIANGNEKIIYDVVKR